MDAKDDPNSDRYVEVTCRINDEMFGGGVYASPEEAVYAMKKLNSTKAVFVLRCYSKKNDQVMMSGRFMRAKQVRQLHGVSSTWKKYPVFKAPIRRRKKLAYYNAEALIGRLKTPDYFKKDFIVYGLSRKDIPPEHNQERREIEAIIHNMNVVNAQ